MNIINYIYGEHIVPLVHELVYGDELIDSGKKTLAINIIDNILRKCDKVYDEGGKSIKILISDLMIDDVLLNRIHKVLFDFFQIRYYNIDVIQGHMYIKERSNYLYKRVLVLNFESQFL